MSGSAAVVRAGIVVTGTELLAGKITDRNGPWLAERLAELGIEVAHVITVGDRPDDLEAALAFLAAQGADLVVTSGGLGPTADDLTAEAVARFAGREMVLDPEMEARIARILAGFARRMRLDPEALATANRKQAMVPRGAATVEPAGTAPGLVVPTDAGPTVIVLPGPPRELQAMWPEALATAEARAVVDRAERFTTASLRLFGIPESEIAETLRVIGAKVDLSELEITTCLRRAELEVDVRHRGGAEEARTRLLEGIAARHARHLYSTDGSLIDEQVARLLRGRRLGVAESCTAGLLAGRLTEPPGASDYLMGGVVSYSDESKLELLGVPAGLLERHGSVSPEVAEAMADGAMRLFAADLACGVTGIAGPSGGSERKPVGYVCVCVKAADGAVLARDPVLPGNRAEIRDRATTVALHMIRRLLLGEDLPL